MGYMVEQLAQTFESFPNLSNLTSVLASIKKSSSERKNFQNSTSFSFISRNGQERFWDLHEVTLVNVKFDPATRQRLGVCVSPSHAMLIGMHPEELLARIAASDLSFPFPDADALIAVLYRAVQATCFGDTGGVVFFRKRASRGLLVRLCTQVVRDGAGRICEVLRTYRAIGPDEYDEATRRRPEACPMFALGDRRSGRQLLADFAADNATPLAALTRTAAGRCFLAGLPAAVHALAGRLMGALSPPSPIVAAEGAWSAAAATAPPESGAGVAGGLRGSGFNGRSGSTEPTRGEAALAPLFAPCPADTDAVASVGSRACGTRSGAAHLGVPWPAGPARRSDPDREACGPELRAGVGGGSRHMIKGGGGDDGEQSHQRAAEIADTEREPGSARRSHRAPRNRKSWNCSTEKATTMTKSATAMVAA